VEDVDITKVLTAEMVMKKSEAVAYLGTDGPRAALRKMKKAAIGSLFVLDEAHAVAGIVTAEGCVACASAAARTSPRHDPTHRLRHPDTPATELIQIIHDLPHPLPVMDARGRLKGVVVRGSLLGAIAERGGSTQ
jgi:glycine betaine/proline transport system ATP-binding protein